MISYCDKFSNLTTLWVNQGISPCFYYTLFPSLFLFVALFLGLIQLFNYGRHSIALQNHQISKSKWFPAQLIIIFLLAIESLVRITLVSVNVNKGVIYGYQWLTAMFSTASWSTLAAVIYVECRRNLPSIPSRGHGLVPIIAITWAFLMENVAFISFVSPLWWFKDRNFENNLELGLFSVRYVLTLLSFVLILMAPGTMLTRQYDYEEIDEEAIPTVPHQTTAGRFTWSNLRMQFRLFWPFMWPKDNMLLQLVVLVCFVLLVAGRVVNLFTPIYYKMIVENLAQTNESLVEKLPDNGTISGGYVLKLSSVSFRWDYILIFVFFNFLVKGTGGFVANLRSLLWTFVQQYTTRAVEVKLFSHLHSLSLRWHLSRKTGEVLRIMDRGTNSINNLLNYMLFNILPTIADILIAVAYFFYYFNAWFALIILLTMILYLVFTVVVTEVRTRYRRSMNKMDNLMNSRAVDSLLNFETVKYYGTESFEVQRYNEAVLNYQVTERKTIFSLSFLNTMQTLIVSLGLLAGSLLSAWYVVEGKLSVGDFVLFGTYINQLYAPLFFFGSYYRMIQQAFIDMENMFELLEQYPEVTDDENAPELVIGDGEISFNNVWFHYQPEHQILHGINFTVPPGQTFALVGPSGAGKSTIMKLLFRFYNIQDGSITIDGQDISKVKQASLRSSIGVVPQDTVLFNDDVEYNIRYGRVDATPDEVYDAARVAEIHDRILSFPDGYRTLVGERGLKLSGGEKQRVAIARTILKSPAFVLLDEATSALDTKTERQIQSSLAKVCENRTTIIVAHRLSTIIHADKIIVLKNGRIVEAGKHEELLQKEDGVYTDMWKQQLTHDQSDASVSSSLAS